MQGFGKYKACVYIHYIIVESMLCPLLLLIGKITLRPLCFRGREAGQGSGPSPQGGRIPQAIFMCWGGKWKRKDIPMAEPRAAESREHAATSGLFPGAAPQGPGCVCRAGSPRCCGSGAAMPLPLMLFPKGRADCGYPGPGNFLVLSPQIERSYM